MVNTLDKKIWQAVRRWWSDVLGTRVYFRYFEKEDRKRRLAGQFLTFITIVLGIFYLLWHVRNINWTLWYYSFTFFLAELIGLLLFSFFAFNAWFLRFHSPKGMPSENPYTIDIFITVAGEAVDLLKATVEAAVQINYLSKKVYILDDKGNVEYQRLAERFGCQYFAREDHRHAKAGNLNYALQRTSGDLILTLDADQVPQSQIINTLIGYFKFPSIAFVQSKQNFKVPIGDPFGNTDRVFYNVMQAGKDTDNAAFSCGSGVIYRRKALEEIGGFSTWNLVEDVHTSMLLHDRGWRSIYYNYPLTIGTAPVDIYGVYRQRKQWAADSLRLLFWDSPLRRKGLTLKQKVQYFHLGFVYLVAGFIMPLFFLTPIWALLTNNFVLMAPVQSYVCHRFPYFVAMSIAYGVLNFPTPCMRAFQMWTGLFPVFIKATWIALRSKNKKPAYQVNVKPTSKVKTRNPWLAILPQQAIIFLSIFSVIYAFLCGPTHWDFYLLNFFWSLWSIWTMSGICLAAVKKHRWSEELTFEKKLSPSFILRAKELFGVVTVTIIVTLFLVIVDMSKVDSFLNGFRFSVLSALTIEKKPVPKIVQEVRKPPEVSRPYSQEGIEKSEKLPMDLTPAEKKEEVVEEKKVLEKEEIIKRENWMVQVASVKTQEQAMLYKEQLMSRGFPAFSLPVKVKGETWMRICVGYFKSKNEAEKADEGIKKMSIHEGQHWITSISEKEM
jgi:cellulose synthase (UDP-forming)